MKWSTTRPVGAIGKRRRSRRLRVQLLLDHVDEGLDGAPDLEVAVEALQASARHGRFGLIGLDGGVNVYGYCGGDPVMFADPSGTQGFLGSGTVDITGGGRVDYGKGMREAWVTSGGTAWDFGIFHSGLGPWPGST